MTTDTLRAGVFGAGALGRHHVRILSTLAGVELVGFHDRDPAVSAAIAQEHGATPFEQSDELAETVDIAVVAVPTVDHAELAQSLLERGVQVLVEKPITATLEEADRIIDIAARRGLVLAVGHVEYHNPAVQSLVAQQSVPRYVEVERLGSFSPRSLDIDVVLDLMIHDLQILHALDPSPVREVRATGIEVLTPKVDIANVRIELESGCVANLTASRVSAEKVRSLRAFMPNGYFSLDYQAQELKGARLEVGEEGTIIHRMTLPVERQEPLRNELESFVRACRGEPGAGVTGEQGRRALATALEIMGALKR